MNETWKNFINDELKKDYFIALKEYVNERRKVVTVLPSSADMFNAMKLCDFHQMKVIIIGSEPNTKDSNGLAFSSRASTRPPILKAITDEIFEDFYNGNTGGVNPFQTNDLTQWAQQGVLLINSVFTVEQNNAHSHKGKGWEVFTEALVKMINDRFSGKLVWMLWGAEAKKYEKLIDEKHLVMLNDHPLATSHNPTAWIGKKQFSKCNQFISKTYHNKKMTINWGLWV